MDNLENQSGQDRKRELVQFAFSFDNAGIGHDIPLDNVPLEIQNEGLAWLHLDASNPQSRAWLETHLNYLDPFILNALLEDVTRPRMIEFGEGGLLILREVNHSSDLGQADTVSLRIWADKTRIVSMSRFDVQATHQMAQKIRDKKALTTSAQFLIAIANMMVRKMEPTIADLTDLIDNIEETMNEKEDPSVYSDVVKLRKKSIIYKRYLVPQRDALDDLRLSDLRWLTVKNKREIHEIYNHLTRYLEDLDALRERAQVVKDEMTNALSVKLNKNMYILSVVSGVFLPLSFITGLFGVNLGGIPGAHSSYAFAAFTAILIAFGLFEIWLFRRMKLM